MLDMLRSGPPYKLQDAYDANETVINTMTETNKPNEKPANVTSTTKQPANDNTTEQHATAETSTTEQPAND